MSAPPPPLPRGHQVEREAGALRPLRWACLSTPPDIPNTKTVLRRLPGPAPKPPTRGPAGARPLPLLRVRGPLRPGPAPVRGAGRVPHHDVHRALQRRRVPHRCRERVAASHRGPAALGCVLWGGALVLCGAVLSLSRRLCRFDRKGSQSVGREASRVPGAAGTPSGAAAAPLLAARAPHSPGAAASDTAGASFIITEPTVIAEASLPSKGGIAASAVAVAGAMAVAVGCCCC